MERLHSVTIRNNKYLKNSSDIEIYRSKGFEVKESGEVAHFTKLEMTMKEIVDFIAFFSNKEYEGCVVQVCQNKYKDEELECECECKEEAYSLCKTSWNIEVYDSYREN
jgi:hypothetical protein